MTFATDHPAEYTFLCDYHEQAQEGGRYNDFYSSLYRTMNKYDNLSDRQLAALQSSIAKQADYAAQRAAEQATASPITAHLTLDEDGKRKGVVITGEVLSTKLKWSPYGEVLKMRVRDDRGFTVWGSVPASIQFHDYHDAAGMLQHVPGAEQGTRVSFVAAITVSETDPTFGFFNRPTQARIIAPE